MKFEERMQRLEAFAFLLAQDRHIARATIGRIYLSTVWIPDLVEDKGYFETMTFPARRRDGAKIEAWRIVERDATREDALATHLRWRHRLRSSGVQALLKDRRERERDLLRIVAMMSTCRGLVRPTLSGSYR